MLLSKTELIFFPLSNFLTSQIFWLWLVVLCKANVCLEIKFSPHKSRIELLFLGKLEARSCKNYCRLRFVLWLCELLNWAIIDYEDIKLLYRRVDNLHSVPRLYLSLSRFISFSYLATLSLKRRAIFIFCSVAMRGYLWLFHDVAASTLCLDPAQTPKWPLYTAIDLTRPLKRGLNKIRLPQISLRRPVSGRKTRTSGSEERKW